MPSSKVRRVNKLFCFALSVKHNTCCCCMLTAEFNSILWERAQKQMDLSQKINRPGLLRGQLRSPLVPFYTVSSALELNLLSSIWVFHHRYYSPGFFSHPSSTNVTVHIRALSRSISCKRVTQRCLASKWIEIPPALGSDNTSSIPGFLCLISNECPQCKAFELPQRWRITTTLGFSREKRKRDWHTLPPSIPIPVSLPCFF